MPDSTVALAAAKVASPKLIEDDDEIDDEIVEVFIEEAGEVRETLGEQFPIWRTDFDNHDALTIVRRAFHTLKGSGRMVKANEIGELAWSIENMLNRVIDKTVPASPHHANLIEHVLTVLPSMIDAYAKREANPKAEETQQFMAWGEALASGEFPEALLSPAASSAKPSGQEQAPNLEVQNREQPAPAAEMQEKTEPVKVDRPVAAKSTTELRNVGKKEPSEAALQKPAAQPVTPVKTPAAAKVEKLKPAKPVLKPVPASPPHDKSSPSVERKRSRLAKTQSKKQAAQSVERMNAKPAPPPASSRWSMVWAVVLLVAMVAIFGLILF